jgi:hypothetical protein
MEFLNFMCNIRNKILIRVLFSMDLVASCIV